MRGVSRALALQSLLGSRGTGFTLDELHQQLDLPKSTVHRLLTELRAHGFATQVAAGGRYFLGPAALEAAFTFHDAIDVRGLVHPLLIEVRQAFDETAHMAVLDHGDVVYLDKVEADHAVRLTSVIGGRNPAHATGVGKALLACELHHDADVAAWVDRHGPLVSRTPHTATTVAALASRLDQVRRRGYSVDDEESELGVRCVAVPVFFGAPRPVAGLSITVPRERLRLADIDGVGRRLRDLVARYTDQRRPGTASIG